MESEHISFSDMPFNVFMKCKKKKKKFYEKKKKKHF
jgi:hypothetical protein